MQPGDEYSGDRLADHEQYQPDYRRFLFLRSHYETILSDNPV